MELRAKTDLPHGWRLWWWNTATPFRRA